MFTPFPHREVWINHDTTNDLFQAEVTIDFGDGTGGIEFRSEWWDDEEDAYLEWAALVELEAFGPVYNPPVDATPWWSTLEDEANPLAV